MTEEFTGQSEGTGFETMQIVLIIIVMILIAGFVFSIYAIKYINQNWEEYRCQPLYMMIAGLIGHDPDENHIYCQKKMAALSASNITEKMDRDNEKRNTIAKTLQRVASEMAHKINSVDSVHNQATQGILSVINNFKGTILFMMEKLKIIIKKLLAIATVIIYTLFSSVIFMKSMMGGTLGGLDNILCFSGDTIINGKPIKDLKPGGDILGVMEFLYNDRFIYKYKDVRVTGEHLVKENEKWIKVKESKFARKIVYNEPNVYCLITKDNTVTINGIVFSDFISVHGNINNYIKNRVLINMKGRGKCLKNNEYYQCGLLGTQFVDTIDGKKQIRHIQIGNAFKHYGRVIGIVKQLNNKWIGINNTITTENQIILYNNEWILAKNHPLAEKMEFEGIAVSINTETGLYINDSICILQYSEIEYKDIENFVEKQLNQNIKCC